MSATRPLLALEDQQLIADAMTAFSERCEADNYTDTGHMWDLFDAAVAIMNGQQKAYHLKFGCDPRRTLRRFLPTTQETKS